MGFLSSEPFISLSKTDTLQAVSFLFATLMFKVGLSFHSVLQTALTESYEKRRIIVCVCVCVCVCVWRERERCIFVR